MALDLPHYVKSYLHVIMFFFFYVFIGAQMCTDASNEWQRYVICLLNSQIMILVTGMVGYHERILGVFDCICICHNNRL